MSTDPSDPFIQHILDVDVIPCLSFSNKQVSTCVFAYVRVCVHAVVVCTYVYGIHNGWYSLQLSDLLVTAVQQNSLQMELISNTIDRPR